MALSDSLEILGVTLEACGFVGVLVSSCSPRGLPIVYRPSIESLAVKQGH